MKKDAHGRFPRLAIVASQQSRLHAQTPAPGWRAPAPLQPNTNDQHAASVCNRRMVVMPGLPRGWVRRLLGTLWSVLRICFADRSAHTRRAAVLSFRCRSERPQFGKKASGSIHWNADQEVANQEGGRG